ncbi:DUF3011 domain-containing protein [Thermomonas carbonis]|uniref:DUF3011 domain-containing protein n=1 Tax=Thermomonas carbonis TaxID=1463158 RepID=A0A7G9SNR3_9GAMM|nr:DUF3011 domain-containing protein [Thermomonas carbonis]QNN69488.1 DUF3011 domain-containing protein [Thermomonas carbonis]GHB93410.1 hypothetical protein GCM10010080_00410 [Thermomonas carbonis]
MRRLIFATAMFAAASAAPAIAAPQSWQEYGPGTGVVRCESNDGRMNRCTLPGGGGRVVLERQHSRNACIEGRTWGQDRGGVWVDDGCRADFRVAGYGGGYNDGYYGGGYSNGGYGQTFRCESDDGRTRQCNGNGRGRAQLVKQLSRASCVEGRTWGSNGNGVWVSQGCRGEFTMGGRGGGYGGNYGGGYGGPGYGMGRLFRCESDDGRTRECAANTRAGVQLVRQLSRAACIQGRTWGYGRNGIWVSDGCRAEFRTH